MHSDQRQLVEHYIANIYSFRCKSNIKTIGSRTHGKHVTASGNKIAYLQGHREFQLRNFLKAQLMCDIFICSYIFLATMDNYVRLPKFPVLTCEIFMMKMQPVLKGKNSCHDLLIVYHIIRDFCIG